MTFLNALTVLDFVYIIVGLVFMLGVGGVFFAFALSFISQKLAMWIDVMKIVKHRNALFEEVTALKQQIATLESLVGVGNGQDKVALPTDVGVQSVNLSHPYKDKP